MKNGFIAALILFTATGSVHAIPFAKGDVVAGNKSYEQHKCNSCHVRMFGGDGSAIFTRPEHKIKTPASLATQIRSCSTNLGLMLFEEEEENLGAYLNNKFYKFK